MNQKTTERKLRVKKETLRQLDNQELHQVAGGSAYRANNCTARWSGCISWK
jgi:hypothetical protein